MDRETLIERIFNRPPPPATYTVTVPHQSPVITAAGTRYPVLLAPINTPSDDGRVIVDTLGWREPPLPFMASDSEMGHGDAIHVGTLTDFENRSIDDTEWVASALEYDTDDDAMEFERLATEQGFRGVSIHMGTARWAPVIQNDDGSFTELTRDNVDELIDERGAEALDAVYDGFFDAEIAAATQVAIPAFPGSMIQTDDVETIAASNTDELPTMTARRGPFVNTDTTGDPDTATMLNMGDNITDVIHAAAFEPADDTINLFRPPAEWFTNPELDGPTGMTVTDDGRVFGHLALWNTCHTGYRGTCVTVPDNPDYSLFLQCNVTTDDGNDVRTGPLVVDEGHIPAEWSVPRSMRHYSQTELVTGHVAVGHDEHGVWVAGAIKPGATDTMVETLRRHPLSGDWRTSDDGEYQLIAAVSVPNPGFAVRPRVMVAAGADDPVGLITFGPAPVDEVDQSTMSLLASAVDRMVDMVAAMGNEIAGLRTDMAPVNVTVNNPTPDPLAEFADMFAPTDTADTADDVETPVDDEPTIDEMAEQFAE